MDGDLTDEQELALIEDDMRQLRRSADDFYWEFPEYRAMARQAARLRKKIEQATLPQAGSIS